MLVSPRDVGRAVEWSRTDVRGDAGQDDLAFVLSCYCGPEVRVVPRIYLAIALDQGSVWIQGGDFFGENAIGPRLGAGCQDDGNAECFCD